MNKILASLIVLLMALLASCVTTVNWVGESQTAPLAERFENKSIAIRPMEVTTSASRFAIDLRNVEITVNGQAVTLQDKYVAQEDDDAYGRVGVLDVNILKKAGFDPASAVNEVTALWKSGLEQQNDYEVLFFNGLGHGNSGYLSNKELFIDTTVWPNTTSPIDGTEKLLFSQVDIVDASADLSGYDYVLEGDIDLSNEVIQIIEVSPEVKEKTMWDENPPQAGQYYLTITAYAFFEIKDRQGNVIVDSKTKGGYFIDTRDTVDILIPVKGNDNEAYKRFFAEADLNGYVMEAVSNTLSRYYHTFLPYYKTTSQPVE